MYKPSPRFDGRLGKRTPMPRITVRGISNVSKGVGGVERVIVE